MRKDRKARKERSAARLDFSEPNCVCSASCSAERRLEDSRLTAIARTGWRVL